MELKEILAISGAPGLYKYVAQGKGGIIVESLTEGRRTMVSGSTKVSALGDIAVFTQTEEVSLGDVLQAVYDKNAGKPVPVMSKAAPEELHAFMASALPEFDKDRVHNSDIKKIAQWYNALVAVGMTSFKAADEETETDDTAVATTATAEVTAEGKKPAPAKKKATTSASDGVKKAAATKRAAVAPKAESRSKAAAARSTTARKAQ